MELYLVKMGLFADEILENIGGLKNFDLFLELNAKFICDQKIGPGAKIRITRSGDVIPTILECVKPILWRICK